MKGETTARLLFCSYHNYLDSGSGAALCVRDLFELLAGRGWDCRVLCGPQLDRVPADGPAVFAWDVEPEVLDLLAGTVAATLMHGTLAGVAITAFDTPQGRPEMPDRSEGEAFLAVLERELEEARPNLVLTYGGHWMVPEVSARAKRHGARVVFWLHNFEYTRVEPFRGVDAVLVPSQFAAEHYRRALGLECTAIPGPWNPKRVHCPVVEGTYVTFVNPQPQKGVHVFARIAAELGRRRPDIQFLVVEGRGSVDWLRETGLDLEAGDNVFAMEQTPDPREFYAVSRLVLMPSLWRESFPRVAAEACFNGIPVVASDRGGLPETLAEAGMVLAIPERYTPETRLVPTAEEVAPWLEAIVRLWDDAAFYERERSRCLAAAEAWRPERLLPRFEEFFRDVASRKREGPE